MKRQSLVLEASQVKEYIEKNKKIPLTNKYADGNIYSIYSTSYLFANLVKDFKKDDFKLADVIRYNQNPYRDTINEKVMKEDYLKMVDNFISYCHANRRVPTFITTQNTRIKVSFELFVYGLAKIITFHQAKGVLPNYVLFNKADVQNNKTGNSTSSKDENQYISSTIEKKNCTNPYTSKPHPTKTGCNQMGQNNNYYCGVSALHKVLYKFGITKYSQGQLAKYAGTTTRGTDHMGLETALAKVSKETGIKLSCKWYYFSELGFEKLGKQICKPNVDAIIHLKYKMQYGHYEVLNNVDTKNGNVKVLNSLGKKCGSCFCGEVNTRSFAIEKQYINAINQKSVMIITKG